MVRLSVKVVIVAYCIIISIDLCLFKTLAENDNILDNISIMGITVPTEHLDLVISVFFVLNLGIIKCLANIYQTAKDKNNDISILQSTIYLNQSIFNPFYHSESHAPKFFLILNDILYGICLCLFPATFIAASIYNSTDFPFIDNVPYAMLGFIPCVIIFAYIYAIDAKLNDSNFRKIILILCPVLSSCISIFIIITVMDAFTTNRLT